MDNEPEIPDSDDLPEDDDTGPDVVPAEGVTHHGREHFHRHTEGFPAHDHSDDDEGNEGDSLTTGHDTDSADAQTRYDLLQGDHLDEMADSFAELLHAHGYSDVETMVHPGGAYGRVIGASHPRRKSLSVTIAHTV
jgi:hypothetical protein